MPPEETEQTISGQQFTEPYRQSDELITSFEIQVAQTVFLIDKADYMLLNSNGHSSLFTNFAIELGAAGIGFGLSILIRYLVLLHQKKDIDIQLWELIVFGITLVISIILFFIGRSKPSDKNSLLNKMKQHFDASPRTVKSTRIRQ